MALGESRDPQRFAELLVLLKTPSGQVRRLAVSAIGKLAGLIDPTKAVDAVMPLLRDSHPQVRQYTTKALSAFGASAETALPDLKDMAANTSEKEYNQRSAASAISMIEKALRIEDERAVHPCQRCGRQVEPDEFARSQRAFQRVFCDKCFDEVYLERRNWDQRVELNKTIETKAGQLVQSEGERRIADLLDSRGIAHRYDERFRIVEGYAIRPDFYLPEFDLHIEYWGMDTVDYKLGMLKKLKLYQQEGKNLISLHREDLPNLEEILRAKLARHMSI